MNAQARELAERLKTLNGEIIEFVEKCTEQDWGKICSWEQWSVGVTARHIGTGHYEVLQLARKIINGEKFPEMTEQQVTEMANQHAREHADCAKPEVLEILRNNGREMVQFVVGLDDSELNRAGYLALFGSDITVRQFIETVILQSGGQHFKNMKSTVGK